MPTSQAPQPPSLQSIKELQTIVKHAASQGQALRLCGSGSKAFYGEPPESSETRELTRNLDLTGIRGINDYQPTELVITAAAGTPLHEIEQTLAEEGQILAFEPPAFGADATLGGCVASGLSGPRRPWAGAVRDNVLGTRIINGAGESLRFGGQVMKNVAGYDVSRLLTGSLGCLGIITEVSLKVLPVPEVEQTWSREIDADEALRWFAELRRKPWPLSATAWRDGRCWWRLSGSEAAVTETARALGGEQVYGGEQFWQDLKEQALEGFEPEPVLWRCALPPASPMQTLDRLGHTEWIEWGGAVRWLNGVTQTDAELRRHIEACGGHASKFRYNHHATGDASSSETGVFHPLSPSLAKLHQGLKSAFDPNGIFNPGRMYPAW